MGQTGGIVEDLNAREMQTVKALLMKFQRGRRAMGNWVRGHLCYILGQNLSAFCLCPGNLRYAELFDGRILKSDCGLLLTAVIQVYSQRTTNGPEKYEKCGEENSTGKLGDAKWLEKQL